MNVDLLRTPLGSHLSSTISDSATLGNEGSTELTRLTLDTDSGTIQGEIDVRARQHWGSIDVPAPTWNDPFHVDHIEVAVDASASGSFGYDVKADRVVGGISIPLGERSVSVGGQRYAWNFGEISIPADRLLRIFQGDLIAALECIPNLGLVRKEFKNEYGGGNKRANLNTVVRKTCTSLRPVSSMSANPLRL